MPRRCPVSVRALALAASFLGNLLLAAATFGQNPLPSGNLYGTALDAEGKSVPGVAVTVQGPGAPQSASTDLNGDFRFLYLPPGTYSLTLERTGFAPVAATSTSHSEATRS